MDNEEKNYQEKSAENGGVRYKKVNLYSGDDSRAFSSRRPGPAAGRGATPRPAAAAAAGGYYRSKDTYRRPAGGDAYQPRPTGEGRGGEGYAPRRSGRYEYRGPQRPRHDAAQAAYGPTAYGPTAPRRQQRPRVATYGNRKYPATTTTTDARYAQRRRIQYVEDNYDPDAPIRLNKYLANAGVCSRRDADKYISAGVVTVNGQVVTELGTKVKRSDEVRFNNEPVRIERKVYVLLNKPKDYVTTSDDPQNRKTVMDLVGSACRERIYPVGRLDRNTTGVLLLTNDGELASKLTHPKYKKKKIYHVFLDQNVSAADMQQLANGITLDDGEVHADAIEYASATDKKQVGIEIHSGRNRIVRRMFETLGYHVTKLDRVYFAGLTKKNLRRGQWRFLTQDEVNYLKMGEFE